MDANRIMNGTFLEVWLDGIALSGMTAFQAKVVKQKTEINVCGQMAVDTKTTGYKGTGSLSLHKIYSTFAEEAESLGTGIDQRHTIVGKLADPDAFGAERLAFYNVSLDEITLMDAAANTPGKITTPFTYTRYEFLDKVVPA